MRKSILTIIVYMSLFIYSPLNAIDEEIRIYKDAASMGMGGVGVSTIGYHFSPIYNPAALGMMKDHDIAPFLTLGISLNPDMMDLIKTIPDIVDAVDNITKIDFDSLIDQAPSMGVNGPLTLGYMGKGFGFWTTTSGNMSMFITPNKNNIFSQKGMDISLNSMVDLGAEYFKLVENGTEPTPDQLQGLLYKHMVDDLKRQGLSDSEIQDELMQIAIDIAQDPDKIKDFIPLAKVVATAEITANLAYGFLIPFKSIDDVSGLSLGATVRFTQRFKADSGTDAPVDSLGSFFSDITSNVYQAGIISSDFGIALRIQNWIFGIAVLDAVSSEFKWKNFDGISGGMANSQLPLALNFGTSYRFYWDNKFIQEVSMYLEFEDTLNKFITWENKVRVGAEVKLFNFLDLRVGMYDSFITGGIGMGWKWFRMDFAYYRENFYNWFVSDQYYLNMTVGLDNSPQRKARSLKRQIAQDRVQAQALELIDRSLEGV